MSGCRRSLRLRGGSGLVITRAGYRGFFHVGGPVEETGRLRYIDGCTDSLLIPPVLLGDPCLNLLHIPPGTRQSAHTHPSVRVGLIVSGRGECVTPDCHYPLSPGVAFVIPPDSRHSFHTHDEALRLLRVAIETIEVAERIRLEHDDGSVTVQTAREITNPPAAES